MFEHVDGVAANQPDVGHSLAVDAAEERREPASVDLDGDDVDCDIFSPNALGAVLNDTTIPRLKAKVVCGGANNQLAEERHAKALGDRGILYAPDYVVNAGGLINVYVEM